jgi:hypothetical protein
MSVKNTVVSSNVNSHSRERLLGEHQKHTHECQNDTQTEIKKNTLITLLLLDIFFTAASVHSVYKICDLKFGNFWILVVYFCLLCPRKYILSIFKA